MFLKFKKVGVFSRPALFVSTSILLEPKVMLMDISSPEPLSHAKELNIRDIDLENLDQPPALAVRPDGSRFYTFMGDQMAEYDSSRSHIQTVASGEFGFPGKAFGACAQASNRHLWFSLNDKIVEWGLDEPPTTCVVGPEALLWTVDSARHRAFIRGRLDDGIYDFGKNTFSTRLWQDKGLFSDFTESSGLLLSEISASSKHHTITMVDPDKATTLALPWGAQAQWGFDGYVYFVRGSNQLWQCKPDSGTPQAVYLDTKRVVGGNQGYLHVLRLSYDRTFLAFYFWSKPSTKYRYREFAPDPSRHGLVLIDLKNQEYIELIGEDLWLIDNMTWLVRGQ